MKCSNCGTENNSDALFCVSCGNKLNSEKTLQNNTVNENNTQNGLNNENNVQTSYSNDNIQTITMTNSTSNNKPKSKWLTIGLPVAILLIVIIAIGSFGGNSSDTSYNSGYQTESGQKRFGNYLVSIGFTKNSSTNYTFYSEGYLYTFDFEDALFSQENDVMYDAYFYEKDMFGIAMVSDGIKLIATYDYSSYNYSCEVEPVSYQSYVCSYMKPIFNC